MVVIPETLDSRSRAERNLFIFAVKKPHMFSDHCSWYPEITLHQKSSAERVISHIKMVFVCHSTQLMVMSDNGPQFDYYKFKHFLKEF